MKLSTLRKYAARSCNLRNHKMKWGNPFGSASGPFSQFGCCKYCKKEVLIRENPAPNDINIGGEAVALNCSR